MPLPFASVRRLLTAALVALAAMLFASPLATPAHASTAGTSADFFGVNATYLRNYVAPSQAASLDGLAASMGDQRISWARLTFDQSVEERIKGTFDWYVPDAMVGALARHGVRAAPVFVGTAYWASDPAARATCGVRAYPADLEGWAAWVAAAAARYGENGTFWASHSDLPKLPIRSWEIGNEVNSHNYWCPAANPEGYANAYSASADAIHAVDPNAQVMVGGLAARFGWRTSVDLDVPAFLSRMIAARPSLANQIPGVGIHPYAATAEDSLALLAQFRQALTSAGMGSTPMIANEVGWYTRGPGGPQLATDTERATQLTTIGGTFWRTDCGVSGLAPYSWITPQQDPANGEHWYGLADPATGAPNLGGLAYGAAIRAALGLGASAPSQAKLSICGGSGSETGASSPAGVPASGASPAPPPDTRILSSKVATRSQRATFTVTGAGGAGQLHFRCSLDGRLPASCPATARFRVTRGAHVFRVVAVDEQGRADPSPAAIRFNVRNP